MTVTAVLSVSSPLLHFQINYISPDDRGAHIYTRICIQTDYINLLVCLVKKRFDLLDGATPLGAALREPQILKRKWDIALLLPDVAGTSLAEFVVFTVI